MRHQRRQALRFYDNTCVTALRALCPDIYSQNPNRRLLPARREAGEDGEDAALAAARCALCASKLAEHMHTFLTARRTSSRSRS